MLVRVRERLGDRDEVRQQLGAARACTACRCSSPPRSARRAVAQRDAVDALEARRTPADGRLAELVDRDDRRVLELREDPRLRGDTALEHVGHAARQVVALPRRLEDHGPAEPAILGREDLRHATAGDRIGRPLERALADQALGQIELDRAGGPLGGGDHRATHRTACEVAVDVRQRWILELGEGRVLLPFHPGPGRVGLHPSVISPTGTGRPFPAAPGRRRLAISGRSRAVDVLFRTDVGRGAALGQRRAGLGELLYLGDLRSFDEELEDLVPGAAST